MPALSGKVRGSDVSAYKYTIETFFKTRGRVTGTDARQVVFKFGGQPWINVIFNGTSDRNLLYNYYMNGTTEGHYTGSTVKNIDDGAWHHVACVADAAAPTNNIRFYIDYRLDRAFTGTLPNIGTGNSLFAGAKDSGTGQ